ncbi:MAG: DUF2076 domain-containing protein [Hyphomicrobiaceae bacterium]
MTPEEHQLISGLFQRMRDLGPVDKDRDAESLIMQSVLGTPDAAYKLVQSVLVQESALEEAANRMQAMEARIQQLESGGQQQAKPASGGFLGGLFGGSKPAPAPVQRASSVPMAGSRGYGQPQQAGSPWGPQGGQPGGYQQGGYQQPPQQAAGGGFMKTAMATAAGVAGGVLVANAIGNMMGGGNQAHAAGGNQGAADAGGFGATANSGAEANEPQYQDPATNDPGNYEAEQQGAQDEGGGGWFGGGGGDDSEF